ncbi:hypothetical protein [Loktanella sp. SALINAS62]|uniref:hypothetical protein n=1 Tax=Loktanella sp. SALINAS62 TaxID=2706124 RepID=UPI001B8B16D3|nr:hypothetical protein [Loktanella sp. SALINAS62]MBS1304186.1 transferrin-binding protein-like solute binding protein [Loktanella sp. SALINAS62]
MMMTRWMICAAFAGLAACGGGGGAMDATGAKAAGPSDADTATTAETTASVKSYTLLQSEGDKLFGTYRDALNADAFTDPTDLPMIGIASFDGVAAYVVGAGASLSEEKLIADADYLSRVDLNVDFGTDRVSGTFDDFVEARTKTAIAGALKVDAAINRAANLESEVTVTGTAIGRVSGSGLKGDVTLDLDGDFLANASALAGRLEGTGQTDGGLKGVQGAFVSNK